jgi:hypothetical protein
MTNDKRNAPEIEAANYIDVPAVEDSDAIEISSAGGQMALKRLVSTNLVVTAIFLIVTLLGGLRLASADNAFVFLKPALICLIFASVLSVLIIRAGTIEIAGWMNEGFSLLKNAANTATLLSLFAATVQVFNSLMPERGLPFWVIGFCFAWTLWNNLFGEFNAPKLLRSISAMFAFAFVVKYLVFANLTAPESSGWLQRIWENPAKEAITWSLDLPRYSGGTGYIQFFAIALYLIGLYLTPKRT